jgi:hypothetical protein
VARAQKTNQNQIKVNSSTKLDVSVAVESADGEARGNDVLVGAFCDDKESSVKGKVVEAKVFVGVFNGEETGFWVVTAEADDSVVWLADSDPAFGCAKQEQQCNIQSILRIFKSTQLVDSSEASVDGELFWVVSGELEVPTVWEGVADANASKRKKKEQKRNKTRRAHRRISRNGWHNRWRIDLRCRRRCLGCLG